MTACCSGCGTFFLKRFEKIFMFSSPIKLTVTFEVTVSWFYKIYLRFLKNVGTSRSSLLMLGGCCDEDFPSFEVGLNSAVTFTDSLWRGKDTGMDPLFSLVRGLRS